MMVLELMARFARQNASPLNQGFEFVSFSSQQSFQAENLVDVENGLRLSVTKSLHLQFESNWVTAAYQQLLAAKRRKGTA